MENTTTELKIYKKVTVIETFDGPIHTTADPDVLDKLVENNKFIKIGDKRIATHQIKSYGEAKLNTIEGFILAQPPEIQKIIEHRRKIKRERVGIGFRDVEEIQNYLSTITSNDQSFD